MRQINPKNINSRKLSGITSVVGLEISDRTIRVAEVAIHGGTLNRFRAHFSARRAFTYQLAPDATPESAAPLIREEMNRRGIRAKYAVTSLQGSGVRSVRADIPGNADGIDEWIQEHFERLVKVPIPRADLTTRREITGKSASGSLVDISFVKNSEIEAAIRFTRLLGLELVSLSAGTRDAVNAFLFSDRLAGTGSTRFICVSGDTTAEFRFHSGRIIERLTGPSDEILRPAGGRDRRHSTRR